MAPPRPNRFALALLGLSAVALWVFAYDLRLSATLALPEASVARGNIETIALEEKIIKQRFGKQYPTHSIVVRLEGDPNRYSIDNGFRDAHPRILSDVDTTRPATIYYYDGLLNFAETRRIAQLESADATVFPLSAFNKEFSGRSRALFLISLIPIAGALILIKFSPSLNNAPPPPLRKAPKPRAP